MASFTNTRRHSKPVGRQDFPFSPSSSLFANTNRMKTKSLKINSGCGRLRLATSSSFYVSAFCSCCILQLRILDSGKKLITVAVGLISLLIVLIVIVNRLHELKAKYQLVKEIAALSQQLINLFPSTFNKLSQKS